MQRRSLKNYTLRYLVVAILAIIGVWAAAFYLVVIEEVYDNIDDGLKDSRHRIISEAGSDPEILNTGEFGITQFKITGLPGAHHDTKTQIYNSELYLPQQDDKTSVRILETIFKNGRQYYRLEIYTSTVEEDDLLEDLLIALAALYVALVVSIVMLNHFILRKAWKPFYKILDKLGGYRLGSSRKFDRSDPRIIEFNNLEEALEAMMERNETIYSRQKQFIENASHELQTPLAIAANKLELLMENEQLTEDQLHKIEEVNNTLHRLKRINKSLLTISKIENKQFQTTETICFNVLLTQLLEEYASLVQFKEIRITLEDRGTFEVNMNRDLATVLVSNLLKNAIVHSGKGRLVEISIAPGSFLIKNEGDSPLNTALIFERFHKGGQNEHSTGLGLSIVQSICNLYDNILLKYDFRNGHCFEIIMHKPV
ncbi:sensor histidine kinase [Niabella aurantiaca]|uniref:sensor histidine kinase n=1 Tax=Niabella aurantiaca TaxID=379900 RepID=UPI00037B8907|nr:HAMP domain-containing sensor histidine kinase [Niabella aurantiaca]